MIDAVLGWHMNPLTCGVAKFNDTLAHQMGVPHRYINQRGDAAYPLVSIKLDEVRGRELSRIRQPYDLFLHDWFDPDTAFHDAMAITMNASTVYAANPVIAAQARQFRPVVEAWCPSTLQGSEHRGAYRVLTFGMAHKRLLHYYAALKAQLDAEHPDYTVEMSTAIHEGHPWEDGLAQSVADMRGIFGDHLRVLGFLGDDALAKELQDCDAVAVYFDPAFRANNTTAWAAIDAGKVLYTNRDEHSPPDDFDHSWDTLVSLLCEK